MIIILLLIIFVLASVTAFIPPETELMRKVVFASFGLLLVLMATFRGEKTMDYANYVAFFDQTDQLLIEPSFLLISKFIHFFLVPNVIFLFLVFAILGVGLKLVAIKQLTPLWFLSLAIYISNFFVLHEMTQIRAGVASAFLLLCIKPIFERDWKRFLLFAALGFTFHYSAIVILPLWIVGREPQRLWLFLAIPIGYFLYFIGINPIVIVPIPGLQEKIVIYQKLQELDDGAGTINVFNIVYLGKICIFYLLLWKQDLLVENNPYAAILLKIYCLSLTVYLVLGIIPAFATRVSEFYGIVDIILIPLFFYVFRSIVVARGVVILIASSFLMVILFYARLIAF